MRYLLFLSTLLSLEAAPSAIDASVKIFTPEGARAIAADAQVTSLADGFRWAEGPVWDHPNQRLLFTDVPKNTIWQWSEGKEGAQIFMKPSGYTGVTKYGGNSGANGLIFDQDGNLLMCEHGDRRISRLLPEGGKETVTDRAEGKRFNSPNDLVLHPDGSLYFTDPPYGLPKKDQDPRAELNYCGVFRLSPEGKVIPLVKNLRRPNGITLSPDARTLYVAHSDPERPVVLAYPLKEDGSLGPESVLADFTAEVSQLRGLPDGLKTDTEGRIWITGPGGVYVLSPQGTRLAHIRLDRPVANLAWGMDGKTLFLTANTHLLAVPTLADGGINRGK